MLQNRVFEIETEIINDDAFAAHDFQAARLLRNRHHVRQNRVLHEIHAALFQFQKAHRVFGNDAQHDALKFRRALKIRRIGLKDELLVMRPFHELERPGANQGIRELLAFQRFRDFAGQDRLRHFD